MINILILSAGTRNKVVQAFQQALCGQGRVVACDCSPLGPAIYDADQAYIVPIIDAPDYIDRILEICRKEKISGVFSLIDPELSLLAAHRERFEAEGICPIVSSYELCEKSLDKYEMYRLLKEMKVPTAECYTSVCDFDRAIREKKIDYPVFVKPVRGSASININKVFTHKEIEVLFERESGLMIQEFMDGQEYGADVYLDLISGRCTHIFLKKKIKMRAGETDKSVSVRNEKAFELIRAFAEGAGFRGMIDIDLFEKDGIFYISEVNPRFGGGYPHAFAAGVDIPSAVVKNLAGEINEPQIGCYREGIYMMKYNEICIRTEEELAGK